MFENIDPKRSKIMRSIKSKDTKPEMTVRRMVHAMGKRYRLHRKDMPGKPDLLFPKLKKVIFVNGCFWHGHDCGGATRIPKSNFDYWNEKIRRNQERDVENHALLMSMGWEILIIWECEIKNVELLLTILNDFLTKNNLTH